MRRVAASSVVLASLLVGWGCSSSSSAVTTNDASSGDDADGGTATSTGGGDDTGSSTPPPPTDGGDVGVATDASKADASSDGGIPAGWLAVSGNRIVTSDGKPFHGRGANLHDERQCDSCTYLAPDPAGENKWIDELCDVWKANFIRFDLTAWTDDGGFRKQWKSLVADATYLADIKGAMAHLATKPGVYAMVTLFADPSIKPNNSDYDSEWPTTTTIPVYQTLVGALVDNPRVLFGLTNEPHIPEDASLETHEAALAAVYQNAIAKIRAIEDAHGSPHHIVVVQAPVGWARKLDYFVAHPLVGDNIAYEVHVYDPQSSFNAMITTPAKKLPILIGEYAPVPGPPAMTDADVRALWTLAQSLEIPHIAWNFHPKCDPVMLQVPADGCGLAGAGTTYTFPTTPWGDMFKAYLAKPW